MPPASSSPQALLFGTTVQTTASPVPNMLRSALQGVYFGAIGAAAGQIALALLVVCVDPPVPLSTIAAIDLLALAAGAGVGGLVASLLSRIDT